MAVGRTISANHLTELDRLVLDICERISKIVKEKIDGDERKRDFWKTFGKVHFSRDAGTGRGGGKLQRDALCTRGRQGKAPFSNRNLRWHPLVVSKQTIDYAIPIKRLDIEGTGDSQTMIFIIEYNGKENKYSSDKIHLLPGKFVVLPKHWLPHIDNFKYWNDTLWTQNSCVIQSMESCNWWNAIEVYAFLAISIAVEYYNLEFDIIYKNIISLLKNQQIEDSVLLPSANFPINKEDFLNCPVCKTPLSNDLGRFRKSKKIETWQPSWSRSKKIEGEDGSIQILHKEPLVEFEIRHLVGKVQFGHRWCNITMSDHSLDETLDFFEYVISAHNKHEK